MSAQAQQTKLAEVKFRAQITNQHLGKSQVFANEPNAKEIMRLLHKRNKEAKEAFSRLKRRGIALSPYLEIGSEYCLRAAILENRFATSGFATDISLASLQAAPAFCRRFKFKKTPSRICADAYNLPFKSNSFPFVFIYETLHHFPDPGPVLKEIDRVLTPDGVCLIGADPVKQKFQLALWRRPNKLRPWEKFLKFILVLPFISHIGKTEVDYGIIEGAFDIKTWQKSLSIFDKVEVKIKTPLGFGENIAKSNKKDWLAPSPPVKITLNFLGGGLEAVCWKSKSPKSPIRKDLDGLFRASEIHGFQAVDEADSLAKRGSKYHGLQAVSSLLISKTNLIFYNEIRSAFYLIINSRKVLPHYS